MSTSEEHPTLDCYNPDYFREEDDEIEESLSWRMDPAESLSDWTLVITHEAHDGDGDNDKPNETIYHVHKNILAVGPCKSDYFASVFRNPHLSESQDDTSRIRLEHNAALAVPFLLDFLYSPTHDLVVNDPYVAVSLRYLSQYFGMKLLYRKVMEYCRRDMKMANLHCYIEASELYRDEKMLSISADLCVGSIQELHPSSPLLKTLDIPFFERILSSPEIDTCSVSCHLSTLVAAYCRHHKTELDSKTFDTLTDRKYVPQIDFESALVLLELESFVNKGCLDEDSPRKEATCLQKRCIKVLAQHWKEFGAPPCSGEFEPKMSLEKFTTFSSTVLVELFRKSLLIAKGDLEDSAAAFEVDVKSRVAELTEDLEKRVQEGEAAVSSIQAKNQRLESEVQSLKFAVAERERELAEYRREWQKMKRVPVNHTFRDLRRCTYHHQSSSEPFDNPGNGIYGRNRPTTMPTIGDAQEDGYLYLLKNGPIYERWPVFYYNDR